MVEAARTAGRPLIEAFHYRYHDVIRRAEDLVRSGALGSIRHAHCLFEAPIRRTPDELRWRADLGGGALMDLGSYVVHALRTLLGEEPTVHAARGNFEGRVDVTMHATLAFPSGAEGEAICAMNAETPVARLALEGSKGRLEIVNFVAPQLGCRFTTAIGGRTVEQPVDGVSTYAAQLAHVIEVVGAGATPLTGGADAVANMAVIDRVYELAGRPGA